MEKQSLAILLRVNPIVTVTTKQHEVVCVDACLVHRERYFVVEVKGCVAAPTGRPFTSLTTCFISFPNKRDSRFPRLCRIDRLSLGGNATFPVWILVAHLPEHRISRTGYIRFPPEPARLRVLPSRYAMLRQPVENVIGRTFHFFGDEFCGFLGIDIFTA